MGAVGVIIERIPHNTVSYAYLEIQASNANEFEALREEALKKIPQYAFALSQPSAPKEAGRPEAPVQPAKLEDAPAAEEGAAVAADKAQEPPSSAPTSTEGLSPREKARLRVAEKGAK